MSQSLLRGILGFVAVVAIAACGGGVAASPSTTATAGAATSAPAVQPSGSGTCGEPVKGTAGFSSFDCTIKSPALTNNLLGDPAEVSVTIMLPDGYEASSARYPSIYMLAGYTEPLGFVFDSFTAGLAGVTGKPQVIVVMVSGNNSLGGSFYVNSPVTGNWDDAIARDVVGFVDGHYRTIAAAKSRGIAGHSMGGSGALSLALHHPELFGAVYAMSPGLFDQDGAEARLGQPEVVAEVLDIAGRVGSTANPQKVVAQALMGGEDVEFEFAYGMAFAPDPTSPLLMKFAYSGASAAPTRDAATWKLWEAGFGALPDRLRQYDAVLKGFAGIAIDYGQQDEYAWIPKGCHYFATLLQGQGIAVSERPYQGTHGGQLGDRMANYMLPFMTEKLAKG